MSASVSVLHGDCREVLKTLPSQSVQCGVTSPPYYGLRDYGHEGQIGLESTPEAYVAEMVAVFREFRRVLKKEGTLWVNLGDSYSRAQETNVPQSKNPRCEFPIHTKEGSSDGFVGRGDRAGSRASALPPKNLLGIPWRVAFALQADGWYLRQDIIWHKPNPMPESVRDRCTKAHEYIFLLSKSENYFFDHEAMQEPAIYGAKGSQFNTGKTGEHQLGRASAKPRTSKVRGEFNGKTNANPGQEAFRAIRETRNRRSVWTVASRPYKGAHFATYPSDLIRPCILDGSRQGDTVLDPFGGSGTTGMVAKEEGRNAILIELNPAYHELINQRCEIRAADMI